MIRFFKRIRILPGLRLNVSRSGVSASVGGRGAWITLRRGRKPRVTVGAPGTGFSMTQGGGMQEGGSHVRPWVEVAIIAAVLGGWIVWIAWMLP